ncbi:hypothetical protein MKX03_020272, partial [Papaver bracteatum]
MANIFLLSFSSLVPQAMNDPGCLPKSGSPHFELFNAAYTGKLHIFKWLASDLAKGGSLEVCKYLIEDLKLDVDSKDGKGTTPLHHAAMKRHLETARYLLEKGANPEASPDDTDATSLHFAALSGDTKIMTLLLSRGVPVDVAGTSGTALHFAAGTGHPDAVRVLLDHGANPDVVGFQGMFTPLISAIYAKSWECVKLLLQ